MKLLKLVSIATIIFALMVTNVWTEDQKPVAEVMFGGYGLSWSPNVSYAQIVLTVSAPNGKIFKQTFDAGVSPGFNLSAFENSVVDGSYTYELRVIPSLPTNDVKNREKSRLKGELSQLKPVTQSGSFLVKGGSIVNPNISETPASTMDQVVVDDMIVSGSLCVGIDCVNGESFGFDTIRLRENNLRIKFQDTSNSGSFPTTDWQITANDSTNGGANKFSIDDIDSGRTPFTIEATAPSNSIYIEDSGQVGFGTATPVTDLHTVTGNTPTLRLDQDGSSGFTPQVWDLAGNEANFFIRDATNSSKMPFRIKPNSETNTLYISNGGYVGINTSSPAYQIHVSNTNAAATFMVERTDGAVQTMIKSTGSEGQIGTKSAHTLRLKAGNADMITATNTGFVGIGSGFSSPNPGPTHLLEVYNSGGTNAYCDGTTWWAASSRASKENITDLSAKDATETLQKLVPVTFNYKAIQDKVRVGFIAEDVPDLVASKEKKNLAAMDIVAVLTKVLQEQQKTIEDLKKEIEEIKKK